MGPEFSSFVPLHLNIHFPITSSSQFLDRIMMAVGRSGNELLFLFSINYNNSQT